MWLPFLLCLRSCAVPGFYSSIYLCQFRYPFFLCRHLFMCVSLFQYPFFISISLFIDVSFSLFWFFFIVYSSVLQLISETSFLDLFCYLIIYLSFVLDLFHYLFFRLSAYLDMILEKIYLFTDPSISVFRYIFLSVCQCISLLFLTFIQNIYPSIIFFSFTWNFLCISVVYLGLYLNFVQMLLYLYIRTFAYQFTILFMH